jgi:hypothetical protein
MASVLGILVGSAISYNFYISYIGESLEIPGKIAIFGGIILLIIISLVNLKERRNKLL